MIKKSSKYLSMEFVMTQVERTGILKDCIQSLICEHVDNDRSWSLDLNRLLFDYYAQLSNYLDVLVDVVMAPIVKNPKTNSEDFCVSKKQVEFLRSIVILMKALDTQLYEKHNISLTIH